MAMLTIYIGSSIDTIILGHLLDGFLQTLGDFEYVSTTTGTMYPVAKVIRETNLQYVGTTAGTIHGNKDIDSTIKVTSPDHIAFTGKLKSGTIASIILRGGFNAAEGRRCLLWEIDGKDGSIRVEGITTTPVDAAMLIAIWRSRYIYACSVYLNGKLVQGPEEGEMARTITTA